jgi:hypothetical protein
MKYYGLIKIPYLAGRESLASTAREALTAAMLADLQKDAAKFIVADLSISSQPDNTVVVRATLRGTSPRNLTSPLDAITRLDASFDRSLMHTGLFEEFDVARKLLRVAPFDDIERGNP